MSGLVDGIRGSGEALAFHHKSWSEAPWARGAWVALQPHQAWTLGVVPRPEGRLHFAGDYTSVWVGWMQGAIESGKRVAREISGA